jgi:hypothetical protein
MDPITITAVMAAVGTAVSAMSASQAHSYNAKVAETQAVYSSNVAANEYTKVQRDADYAMGRLRARRGASGRTESGSALDVLHESYINFELDALNAKYEGEVQAVGYRNEARMERYKGKMELVKGVVGLASGQLAGMGIDALGGTGGSTGAPKSILPGGGSGSYGGSAGSSGGYADAGTWTDY